MTKILLFTFYLFITPTGFNGKKLVENIINSNSEVDSKLLRFQNAYDSLIANPSNLNFQNRFFNLFPNNFNTFNQLFGCSDGEPFSSESEFGQLYSKSNSYIDLFFSVTSVSKDSVYNKIIEISSRGRWYPDGVGYFRLKIIESVRINPVLFIRILDRCPEDKIYGFWKFYFDCPYPTLNVPDYLIQNIDVNSKSHQLLFRAYRETILKWDLYWKGNQNK